MANTYNITVTNKSSALQGFYFFQKPAVYVGGPKVYSNSIAYGQLRPGAGGGQLQFALELQYCAGIQTQLTPPVVGQAQTGTAVVRDVDLTPQQGPATNNQYDVQIDPLGLKGPNNDSGVQPGAFRLTMPKFNPNSQKFNAGLGVKAQLDGFPHYELSNFITAEPQKNIDVQPVLQFFVATGDYLAGQVVNFTTSSVGAALCDATDGTQDFYVEYTIEGGWMVNGAPQVGLTQAA